MQPSLYEVLPWIAALGFVLLGVMHALGRPPLRGAWIAPATLAGVFLGWSLFTIVQNCVTAVWVEHTRNAWGNQIWFDLLLATGLAMVLLFPRARAVGMHPLPWFLLVAASGSVGLYAMLARCMFLEERHPARIIKPSGDRPD
ncbi:MAG: hypothetical protein KGO51_08315 [Alphaproteobacteria bacterium]|nr:hypothetical protein [Alphaproteobacteria bacterium]